MKNNAYMFWGLTIITIFCCVAFGAQWISPFDPSLIDGQNLLMPPSLKHWLGTDGLGRDLLSRMIFGARISLSVGIIAVGISIILGIILGSLAGFYGQIVDVLIMRLADIMLCFPTFFLILAIIAIVEPSIYNIMIVIGLTSWMGPAR